MGRERREVWIKRVERWRDSGLSAREFATEIGVEPGRLRRWKWELARTSAKKAASTPAKQVLPFVEVTQPAMSSEPAEPIEIVAPSGLRVRVPARFDDETLRRVLGALR